MRLSEGGSRANKGLQRTAQQRGCHAVASVSHVPFRSAGAAPPLKPRPLLPHKLTGASVSEERRSESSWLLPVRELVPQPAWDSLAAPLH